MSDNDRKPAIRILQFWTEYVPDPAKPGEMKGVDWVEWGKIGDKTGASTRERVHALAPRPGRTGPVAEAIEWQAVGPAYERWKASEEIPENGTPLAAWPGADRALVDVLKKFNILTIEDFVGTADHVIATIPIPNPRKRRKMAEDFLLAQGDISRVQSELTKRDDLIDRQARELDDIKQQLAALTAAQPAKTTRAQKAA